ncbi:uncharacterized protein [Panulirus ornatus]|uniref:uncharacterized protein n=1 Tax=Panulirus ornatus TaxID=150431 RepID=UPI003A8826E7
MERLQWATPILLVAVKVLALALAHPSSSSMTQQRVTSVARQQKTTMPLALTPRECEVSGKRGSCLPYFYCGPYGGSPMGMCTLGLGQCCVFDKTCGETSSSHVTYLTSQGDDATDTGTCSITVTKADENICQLRLYMKELELSEPNADGVCVKQYLHVQGISGGAPRICGTNSGQHLYVDVRADTGPYKVGVVNMDNNPLSSWDIEVQQVPCDSDELAPTGCNQYFTELSGTVKSFNYGSKPSSKRHRNGNPGSRHLQETYTICVRQEPGYCSLKWTPAPGDEYAFTLTGNLIANPNLHISPFNVADDELCPFTDHLLIAGGRIPKEDNPSTVFCGSRFPDSVTTNSFQIMLVANGQEVQDNDIDNRGFHLQYQQVQC